MKAKQSGNVKKPVLIMGIAFIALGCTLGVSSFAWFLLPQTTKKVDGIDGEATGSYFSIVNEETDKADGTATNPYGIKTAKQLYYFNWLQDLGYFNKDEDGDGKIDQQYYFVLMNDIDASDYVLPPAGTKEFPFVGNFEGGGFTISNLKISNSWNDLTNIPNGAKQDSTATMLSSAEIVGFFGIIGQYSSESSTTADDLTTGTINCKGKDGSATNATYTIRSVSGTGDDATTTYINAVNNLYFDNLQVSTIADNTLAGLLAGYVNGQMQYCGARAGYFTFGSGVQTLKDDTVGSANDKLSKYSIVGDYNSNNFNWKGKPKPKGSGDDYGSSIDIYTISKRTDYMMDASSTSGSSTSKIWSSDTYHIKAAVSKADGSVYNYESDGNTAGYVSGSYIPLSISDEPDESNYQNKIAENVPNKNGGYIVGGLKANDPTFNNSTVRIRNVLEGSGQNYGTISNGILNSVNSQTSISSSQLSFLYYDTVSKTHHRIKDSDNASTSFSTTELTGVIYPEISDVKISSDIFNNYTNVKNNFINSVTSITSKTGNTGTKIVIPSLLLAFQSSLAKYTATGGIKIAGKDYTSYEFYEGGINFTLQKSGYVSALIGTYNTSEMSKFYKLYSLDRDEETDSTSTITNAKEITQISGSVKNKDLAYKYTSGQDADFSDSKVTFSLEGMNSSGVFCQYAAYFFEIPLKAGSYFITSGSSDAKYPYLLYFDIGQDKTGEGEGEGTDIETPDIDFVYYKDAKAEKKEILPINDSSFKNSNVYFGVNTGVATVYYWRDSSESVVYYCVLPSASSESVIPVGAGSGEPGEESAYKAEFETSN